MTYDEFEAELIKVVAPLHDLKERVLKEGMDSGNSPLFDAGIMAAHCEGLLRMLDWDGDVVKAEMQRQMDQRLLTALRAPGGEHGSRTG